MNLPTGFNAGSTLLKKQKNKKEIFYSIKDPARSGIFQLGVILYQPSAGKQKRDSFSSEFFFLRMEIQNDKNFTDPGRRRQGYNAICF